MGRTGRAGVKGTAITFITPEQEKYAPDLVRALSESSRPIPKDLQVSFLCRYRFSLPFPVYKKIDSGACVALDTGSLY